MQLANRGGERSGEVAPGLDRYGLELEPAGQGFQLGRPSSSLPSFSPSSGPTVTDTLARAADSTVRG